MRPPALIGAVQSALRGRAKPVQVRDLLRERERQSAELAEQDEKLRAALHAVSKQAEQLRLRDRLEDQFLATLAHELRIRSRRLPRVSPCWRPTPIHGPSGR